jgi:hypothetical protein
VAYNATDLGRFRRDIYADERLHVVSTLVVFPDFQSVIVVDRRVDQQNRWKILGLQRSSGLLRRHLLTELASGFVSAIAQKRISQDGGKVRRWRRFI